MTLRYCGTRDLFEEIAKQGAALTKRKLKEVAKRAAGYVGVFAKKLQKLIARLLPTIELVSEKDLDSKLERLIKEKGLLLKATEWGF